MVTDRVVSRGGGGGGGGEGLVGAPWAFPTVAVFVSPLSPVRADASFTTGVLRLQRWIPRPSMLSDTLGTAVQESNHQGSLEAAVRHVVWLDHGTLLFLTDEDLPVPYVRTRREKPCKAAPGCIRSHETLDDVFRGFKMFIAWRELLGWFVSHYDTGIR